MDTLWRRRDASPPPRVAPENMPIQGVFSELRTFRGEEDERRREVKQLQGQAQAIGRESAKDQIATFCDKLKPMLRGYEPEVVVLTHHDKPKPQAGTVGLEPWGLCRMGKDQDKPVDLASRRVAEALTTWNPLDACPEVKTALDVARTHTGTDNIVISGIVDQLQLHVDQLQERLGSDSAEPVGRLIFDTNTALPLPGRFWVLPCKWDNGVGVLTDLQLILVIPQTDSDSYVCPRLMAAAAVWAGAQTAILVAFCVNRPVSKKRPMGSGGGGGHKRHAP